MSDIKRLQEEILLNVFNPASQDCQTVRQDLQLGITLNPDLELIEQAMDIYALSIAEKVAVGFSEWIAEEHIEYLKVNTWIEWIHKGGYHTTAQLFALFKESEEYKEIIK